MSLIRVATCAGDDRSCSPDIALGCTMLRGNHAGEAVASLLFKLSTGLTVTKPLDLERHQSTSASASIAALKTLAQAVCLVQHPLRSASGAPRVYKSKICPGSICGLAGYCHNDMHVLLTIPVL